jgi:translation initiation factor IF-3
MEVFNINRGQEKQDALLNENVRFSQVLLIDESSNQLGVMSSSEALQIARERGFDLLCVAPLAKTPVCKLVDYKKLKFEQQKNARLAKKKQTVVVTKEIVLSPVIGSGDFDTKLKQGMKFLNEGNRLKVTLSFKKRGRLLNGGDPNIEVIERYIESIGELATIESKPSLEGRNVIAVLAAKKQKK